MNILEELTKIFKIVFDKDDILLKNETVASDIEGWDSLTHISLIAAIESYFKIEFDTSEVLNFHNVGDLVQGIEKHVK